MTTETGKITRHKSKDPYARIKNSILQNDALSWKARGIMAYVLSLPDDWKIYKSEIQKHSKSDQRASFDSGWKELVAHGYIKTEQYRDEVTNQIGYKYDLFEDPEAGVDFPSAAPPSAANPQLQSTNSVSTDKQTKKEQKNMPDSPAFDSPSFDNFWVSYLRKGSKADALAQWNKLTAEEKVTAYAMIPDYITEMKERVYLKDAQRYLGKKIFNDVKERLANPASKTATTQPEAQNQTQVTLLNPLVDDSQVGYFRDQVNLKHMNLVAVKKLSPEFAKIEIANEYANAHLLNFNDTYKALFPYAEAPNLEKWMQSPHHYVSPLKSNENAC
jgi:hypothetical protein